VPLTAYRYIIDLSPY